MRSSLIALTLIAALAAAPELPAETFRFDMGSETSELRDGFTRITAASVYSNERGYGWKSTDGLEEHHRHYSREWEYSESRGRTQPPPIYTNEITCDTIFGRQSIVFFMDVPPGEYTVYVLCGRSAGSSREYHKFDVVAGTSKSTVTIAGPYRFEKCVLTTPVRDGKLAIGFIPRTDWLAACLIVFPTAEEQKVRSELLDALEQEVYFLPPDVAQEWKRTEHVDDRPLPELSAVDRRRGYALFARHWSQIIYPNTVPRESELGPELKAFASLGEYEPVTFTVFPLRDLKGAQVTAGDLRSGDSVISAQDVDIRSVRYMLVRPNYSTFFSYHVAPDVLEHRDSVDVGKGQNQRYWVTVKVPDDAKPGIYKGKLTFTPAEGEPAHVPLELRVLPIRLQKNPEHVYGMYYRDPLSNVHPSNSPEANDYFGRKAEMERQDMVAHGMNSHISDVSGLERDDEGHWTMDGAETERRIALDRKYGLADRPLVASFPVSWWYSKLVDGKGLGSHLRLVRADVPESFFDEVTRMVEAIEQEKKKYDWPELLYYPIDEPSTSEDSVRFMVNVLKAIKKVPGVRTYVTADPSHEQFAPMWPYVEVWGCQPFVFGSEKIKRLGREKNVEFWCYPNHISGENDHTPVRGARMTWGFGFWKSGFKTLIPWIYQSSGGDPWNYLDSTSMDFFNRATPDGEPIPVTMWEAYREGIDDGRYVHTLQKLVEQAKERGGTAAELAREGEKELAFVWDSIEVQEKYKYDGLWSGADFDAYRWLLASKIIHLQEALK
ncbi:MAG: glycoside hydrolase domain-containing protein [Planctomycetota bacterium]